MKKTPSHFSRKYLILGVFFVLISFSVYAAVMLPWGPEEKQSNGFLVMAGQNKNINVYSECKKVTATTKNVFVPTGTQNEWDKFKLGASNVGASLSACGGMVNGVCSSSPAVCISGTVSGDNGNTTPGGTRTWNCLGSGGGTNTSCNYTNPAAACVPNGSYTYGSCSVSCGGGSQDRFDSCGNYYDTQFTNCNPGSCACVPTSYSAWGACSVSCGGGTQTRTDNCGNSESQACNTQACPTTGPYSYGAWGACSVSCGGGTQTRTETCSYDTCTNPQPTSQSCNTQACSTVGHWQYGYTEVGYATHCGGIDPVPSGSCTIGNTTIRFVDACADPAAAEMYDCVP